MGEKIVISASEAAGSYFSPLLIGAMLAGGAAAAGALWYCLCGSEENISSVNVEKERKELCEKLKKISDSFLVTSHESISLKSLNEAKSLCGNVREKFDLSLSENYSLSTKLLKLEREIDSILSEKQYLKESIRQNNGYIV